MQQNFELQMKKIELVRKIIIILGENYQLQKKKSY